MRSYLVLDEELDTLNGRSGGLGDSSGNTTHQEVDHEARHSEELLLRLDDISLFGHLARVTIR